jgi:hypothetical protein
MQALLTALSNHNVANQQSLAVEKIKKSEKKKKTLLKITIVKIRLFFWNLSPLHWYDDFKTMKIDLNEFVCKKTIFKDKN